MLEFSQAFIQICIFSLCSDVQSIYCVNSLRTSFSFLIFLYRFQYRPIIFLFFLFSSIFVPLRLFDRCARAHRENFLHDAFSPLGLSSLLFDLKSSRVYAFICDRITVSQDNGCTPSTESTRKIIVSCNLCYCFDRFRVSKNSRVSVDEFAGRGKGKCAHVFHLPSNINRREIKIIRIHTKIDAHTPFGCRLRCLRQTYREIC